MLAIGKNLVSGLRLAAILPVRRDDFVPSLPGAVVFAAISLAVANAFSYAQQSGEIYFNPVGVLVVGTIVLAFVGASLGMAAVTRRYEEVPGILFAIASAMPWYTVAICTACHFLDGLSGSGGFPFAVVIWALVIFTRACRLHFDGVVPGVAGGMGFLIVLFLVLPGSWVVMQHYSLTPTFFFSYDTSDWEEYTSVDSEAVYYAQRELVADKTSDIAPGTTGEVDVFFIGFAGNGDQGVFESEAKFAGEVVDKQFGTSSRTVVLHNDLDALDSEPLANSYNLFEVIDATAGRMDLDEDVLFVFLTSHGSSEGWIDVSLFPLDMQPLYATDLRQALDASGVRWRIVVVSACYSGSFVEPLQDDHTLVITASAADRNSFGCSDERELTYFGEAFLRDAFSKNGDIVAAFETAQAAVIERERQEGRKPSNPQISIGKEMYEKLLQLGQPQ